ncbi:MAG: hypothetical protein WCF84_01040 [Anaerolineae bacterium]
MQQPANISELTNQLQARFETVRKSEYFPAILGAVAGGVVAALIAAVIASRGRTVKQVVVQESAAAEPHATTVLGFTLPEIMQLATVVTQLARQVQEWRASSR